MYLMTQDGNKRFLLKCNENSKSYNSMSDAASDLGIKITDVRRYLSGKLKNARGYTFRWVRPRRKNITRVRPDLRKRVRCKETGKIYPSVDAAAKAHAVDPARMVSHLRTGKPAAIAGRTFIYANAWDAPRVIRWRHRATGRVFNSCAAAAAEFGISAKSVHRGGTAAHRFDRLELTRDALQAMTRPAAITHDLFAPL